MRNEFSNEVSLSKEVEIRVVDASKENSEREDGLSSGGSLGKIEVSNRLVSEEDRNKSIPFELYKRRTTVVVRRESFLNVVCDARLNISMWGLTRGRTWFWHAGKV
jgi:hypothetical protein